MFLCLKLRRAAKQAKFLTKDDILATPPVSSAKHVAQQT